MNETHPGKWMKPIQAASVKWLSVKLKCDYHKEEVVVKDNLNS